MKEIEDKDTRYYIDIDPVKKSITGWNYGRRQDLIEEESTDSKIRIFVTRGQYNKLDRLNR